MRVNVQRWIRSVVMALLCIGTVSVTQAQDLTDERRIAVAERLEQSTVSVVAGSAGGSGFVVGDERWVVTNAHVVRSARRGGLAVRFSDRTERRARILAVDHEHDLAVLEVAGGVPVTPLVLANSDEARVGQTVLAYGSPFGLDGTLTQGIVSARRDMPSSRRGESIRGVIQTDAPINPGNSGGPLVGGSGQVIGVNTAILSRTGGSHGIGFAVPSNYVRELLAQVRAQTSQAVAEGGGAERSPRAAGDSLPVPPVPPAAVDPRAVNPRAVNPRAVNPRAVAPRAVAPRAVDPRAVDPRAVDPRANIRPGPGPTRVAGAAYLGVLGGDFRGPGFDGVRLEQVVQGSPAARAGLAGRQDPPPLMLQRLGIRWDGHVIVGVDGERVRNMGELQGVLRRHRPGQRVTVHFTTVSGELNGETVVQLSTRAAE